MGKEKKIDFFLYDFIYIFFYESGVKTYLKLCINKCLKDIR